jgi:hypothetical protein
MADVSRRSHDAYADQFEAEVGDPLYESVEGALIWELAVKRGCVGPHADLAAALTLRASKDRARLPVR